MYLNIDLYLSIGILLVISALFTIGGNFDRVNYSKKLNSDEINVFVKYFKFWKGGASAVIWYEVKEIFLKTCIKFYFTFNESKK